MQRNIWLQQQEVEQPEEMVSTKTASLLVLLSGSQRRNGRKRANHDLEGRVFECKTCSRRFPTFQALGGHRTSHKRPRFGGGHGLAERSQMRPRRVHQCPVCGLGFPMGQALGGHMRRHKAGGAAPEKKAHGGKVLWFDLNLTPLENELEVGALELGLGLVEEIRMADDYCISGSPTA